jgi:hypothetical protein
VTVVDADEKRPTQKSFGAKLTSLGCERYKNNG